MKYLYKYPQAPYPHDEIVGRAAAAGGTSPSTSSSTPAFSRTIED